MISDIPVRIVLAILILAGLLSLVMAATADANPNCAPRSTALNAAKKLHSEVPVFIGPADAGSSVIITLSPKGTWSVFACTIDRCCLMAGGGAAIFLRGA